MNYILITPIKEEAKSLLQLKVTILNQTRKPLVWVIGDGNSQDGSFHMAKELFKDYEWIHVIKVKSFYENGYSHKNIAGSLNDCYKFSLEICSKNKIEFSFIGRTDATPILAEDYFEVLMTEMKQNPKLAFVCGLQHVQPRYSKKRIKNQIMGISKTGFNDIGLYRREFLEEMGSFPITYSPETVMQIKALHRGWELKLIEKTHFIKPRLGGSKIGVWKGYKLKGKYMYALGFHPLLVLPNALYTIFFPPHYQGAALLLGYFASFIRNEEKVDDKEVIEYFSRERLKQILKETIYGFLPK